MDSLKDGRLKERCLPMGRRGGTMSDTLKVELAKELGFYDTVQRDGWGGITTRDAGNLVKRAIEMAERSLAQQSR
jgi:small acid-soluble spore protein F (minor alpha/beta-type SASP)